MPVIREARFPSSAFALAYQLNGPCVTAGVEVWSIEGKRMMVGRVQKVVRGQGVYIQRPDGTVFRTPMQSIMMSKAPPKPPPFKFSINKLGRIERMEIDEMMEALRYAPEEHLAHVKEFNIATPRSLARAHGPGYPPGGISGFYDDGYLFVEAAQARGTVPLHEVGHAVWSKTMGRESVRRVASTGEVIYGEKTAFWKRQFGKAKRREIRVPSSYALNNVEDFFCEMYAHYYYGFSNSYNWEHIAPEIMDWFKENYAGLSVRMQKPPAIPVRRGG